MSSRSGSSVGNEDDEMWFCFSPTRSNAQHQRPHSSRTEWSEWSTVRPEDGCFPSSLRTNCTSQQEQSVEYDGGISTLAICPDSLEQQIIKSRDAFVVLLESSKDNVELLDKWLNEVKNCQEIRLAEKGNCLQSLGDGLINDAALAASSQRIKEQNLYQMLCYEQIASTWEIMLTMLKTFPETSGSITCKSLSNQALQIGQEFMAETEARDQHFKSMLAMRDQLRKMIKESKVSSRMQLVVCFQYLLEPYHGSSDIFFASPSDFIDLGLGEEETGEPQMDTPVTTTSDDGISGEQDENFPVSPTSREAFPDKRKQGGRGIQSSDRNFHQSV